MTVKSSSTPSLSVGRMTETLANAYLALIRSGTPFKEFPSVMLWGAPGVGKSQGVRAIAGILEERTGKTVKVTDVRLLLFNPIDLRGIPTANAEKTLAVWLKPKIFDMDGADDVINILFLDEISAAPQSVQAAAYQITLDRVVGEHRLPDNCIVIGAGNRVTDKSVAYKMPKALANRFMHIEIEADFDSWCRWAVSNGINHKVVAFLSFRRDYFLEPEMTDNLAYPTPRSWEMVSKVLNSVSSDISEVYPLIAGLVGSGIAAEFKSFDKIFSSLPSIEDIFSGKQVAVPKSQDVLYALISSMTDYASKHKDNMRLIENSMRFAMQMPPDFSAVLMRNYMYLEDNYKMKLMGIPIFVSWLSKAGRYINA